MLISAIAIAVGEYVSGGMWSVAAEPEIHGDLTNMQGNEIVKGADFFVVGRLAFGEFLGLRFSFRGDRNLRLLQRTEPRANILPRGERRQTQIGRVLAVSVLFPVRNFGFFGVFEIGRFEGVNSAIGLVTNGRLWIGVVQFYRWRARDVDLDHLFQQMPVRE